MELLDRLRRVRVFTRVAADALLDSSRRSEAALDHEFRRHDPWGYETPESAMRFDRELALIRSRLGDCSFGRVLEVGCAEGIFTERLAPLCQSLLAVDVNETALARATARCAHLPNVQFRKWNLRADEPADTFDLVVATSVLEYFMSPRSLRAARARLVAATRPGGLLLIGNVRQNAVVEQGWWAQYLPRGGRHVNAFISEHPDLQIVAEADGHDYLEVLLSR